jgi:hypothetical protein
MNPAPASRADERRVETPLGSRGHARDDFFETESREHGTITPLA